jgi:hypothetical protein
MSAVASGGVVAVASWLLLITLGLEGNRALFLMGTAAGFLVFIRGVIRIAIDADREEIVVRNVWRTHLVRWSTVESIDLAGMIWPGAAAFLYVYTPLRIRTHDGHTVYIQASIADFKRVVHYLRDATPPGSSVKWGFRFD